MEPSWKKYEEGMHSDNEKEARKAGELFQKERKWDTDHNPDLARWEKGRKESIVKQKPAWVKQQVKQEKETLNKELNKFKEGGKVDFKIHPTSGYLLIKIIQKEEKTQTGLIISSSDNIPNEVADVIAVGGDIILDKNVVPTPCEVGDRVLLKKMAGLEVTSYGENLRICLFSDVLAILEE